MSFSQLVASRSQLDGALPDPNSLRVCVFTISQGPNAGPWVNNRIDPSDPKKRLWVYLGGGNGPVPAAFEHREDASVNGAWVDSLRGNGTSIRTNTQNNNPGGFVGGGTGNKGILGNNGFDGMPLSEISSIMFHLKNLSPTLVDVHSLSLYCNFVVEFDPVGSPGQYALFVLCQNANVILNT